jgi:hypothetical protein
MKHEIEILECPLHPNGPVKGTVMVPVWLAALLVGALISLQAWELSEISSLKVSVAALAVQVNLSLNKH